MADTNHRAIAVVGLSAIMPDAPDAQTFWANIKQGKYSIAQVPPDRWDVNVYYDPDRKAPDKSYSKIGGWVRNYEWDPIKWRLPIPPRVQQAMDIGQHWAVACTRMLLEDYGYPERPLNKNRTAVVIGNAMGGERHYVTALRISQPEYVRLLTETPTFASLPEAERESLILEFRKHAAGWFPPVTEDSMPGELSNCIAGRIANIFNFNGPNYTCDAACASAMAAITAAVGGLIEGEYDSVVTGGVDRNMGASTFVKFCKIGALSGRDSRPFAEGADGFVMGEGAALLLLKRLRDAERDGDKVYAVLRGMGASSDGKGKGITAPNPVGQRLAVQRAWQNAGLRPHEGLCIEGHGTSTAVGDAAELQSMQDVFGDSVTRRRSIALGSVKSNIGHLKGAAGAAGLFKASMALRDKVLPPSINFFAPNPGFDFDNSPFYVNTELQDWKAPNGEPRRTAVSAFGFGGTNFHVVMEEHIPGLLTRSRGNRTSVAVPSAAPVALASAKPPPRGAIVLGAANSGELASRLSELLTQARAGQIPPVAAPRQADLAAPERIALDYGDAEELTSKTERSLALLEKDSAASWKAVRARGIFRGSGPAPKVAFLYTGQGSQYVNMLRELRRTEPIVREVFDEADRIMARHLEQQLSSLIFVDELDEDATGRSEEALKQTAITQPAVLTVDYALTRLLAAYGVHPDLVMGHSLGEYGALVAAGGLPFADALEAVSARGREMTRVNVADKGKMAAIFAPLADIEKVLNSVRGYAVIANLNSTRQAVVGGSTEGVEEASAALQQAGYNVVPLQVSHAFHTKIVASASGPLREVLARMQLSPPRTPIVANVTGTFYPMAPDAREAMLDILAQQLASPVQFVKGLQTLYAAGARVFVEIGPKRALQGFAEDVLGEQEDVITLCTNHPKFGDIVSVNRALCALYASGLGTGSAADAPWHAEPPATSHAAAPAIVEEELPTQVQPAAAAQASAPAPQGSAPSPAAVAPFGGPTLTQDRYLELGKLFADFMDRGRRIYEGAAPTASPRTPVCITGAGLGLPGVERVFDELNVQRLLRGEQFIKPIPVRLREAQVAKRITRLVKSSRGEPEFVTIDSTDGVVKLAGRSGSFDLAQEYGVAPERIPALDHLTQLAVAVGIEALRDAGIPLVLRYRTTSKGTQLPNGWGLPEAMRDDTGIVFAAAFPGTDSIVEHVTHYSADQARRQRLQELEELAELTTDQALRADLERRISALRVAIQEQAYFLDRRFIFRLLTMGHSQFGEIIGARGPNTHVNSACASTTQAFSVAEDWISSGRCRRVIIVSADDVTSDRLMEWFGPAFLATGAAATEEVVEEVATPFDRRRHGMVVGMGAAAIVVESAESARERAVRPICELLSTVMANSAFHGTRLDVEHITQVMETLVRQAEIRWGITREQFVGQTVFVSHETYTPARGGSAAAEVHALRRVFGAAADQVVIANTKGYTGHAMGAGMEDVLAIKSLETGIVPPVPNFKEVDPDLGLLNLSRGGPHPVQYALRLGAGFGSQISMTLMRHTGTDPRPRPDALGFGYRVTDSARHGAWLAGLCGHPTATLEVVHRTLRIKDQGPPVRPVTPSRPLPVAPATGALATAPALPAPAPIAGQTAPEPLPQVPPAATDAPSEFPPPAIPPSLPPPPPADDVDPVEQRVLALVAQTTGYDRDMLALDLDLEADLGIDTVKQAEVFASIREAYDIPRDDSLKLRDYPTLGHVIQFVRDRAPQLPAAPATVPSADQPIAAAGPEPDRDELTQRVLQLVAQSTGYPEDMLALDLDLEADLGIDTVKQAEVFASIREAYDIPRDDSLKLRDYPTLGHVIQFVRDCAPNLRDAAAGAATAPAPAPVPAPSAEAAPARVELDQVGRRVLALVAETTGYPEDMLDLELDLEADLGIDTVKQAEVFASIREAYDIPRDDSLKLRDYPSLAHVIQFVRDHAPSLAAPTAPPATPTAQPIEAPENSVVSGPAEGDEIERRVLALVAEKTGYPEDMLDPDLDLEADLGIDTVKQAEVFASIREAYDIPRDDSLKLRDYPSLAHVIQFVRDRMPAAAPPGPAPSRPARSAAPKAAPADGTPQFPRRVAAAVLRPALKYCKPTGVFLEAGQRVVVAADEGGAAEELIQLLETRAVSVLRLPRGATRDELSTQLQQWLSQGPIHGIYWLPALDRELAPEQMNLESWRSALEERVKLLSVAVRASYEQLGRHDAFLVSATRLGGRHGYDPAGAVAPLGGAVSGFTKAVKRERPDALIKCVDFELEASPSQVAALLVDEVLRDPGAVEIGHASGLRWSVALEQRSAAADPGGLELSEQSVFVVTGAAGSIVSAIVEDLAASSGGHFYLLDLTPEPDAANPDLDRLATDRNGLKRELFERLKQKGERATPALVEKELATLERSRAALLAIRAIQAAGGTAYYHSVDLRDPDGVARAVNDVRQRHGRIDVLMHAAGLEVSRTLPDKSAAEFDLVFDVKCDGWFNLLHAAGDLPIAAAIVFSSIAGRFGNLGQTDYSAANDLLCKSTSSFRTARPATRGIAVDWTAWAEIGMAARGSIPKLMEAAGIDMLPPTVGVPVVRRELCAGGFRGEVVVAGSLGEMVAEFDETGGLDPSALAQTPKGPMLGDVVAATLYEGLTVETVLDPTRQAFLYDHQIEGTPVLPGVMGVEGFAELALLLLPGYRVVSIENVEFAAPFKFYRNQPRTVTLNAVLRTDGDSVVADCRLTGTRLLSGQEQPQTTTHFTARVRLARGDHAPVSATVPEALPQDGVKAQDIYHIYFHGPAYQVLESAWRAEGSAAALISEKLPPNHDPSTLTTVAAPRLIESCFQAAGVLEVGTSGRMGLPQHVDQVVALKATESANGRRLYVLATPNGGGYDALVMDSTGQVYVKLSGYRTIQLPDPVDDQLVAPLRAAMHA